MARAAGGWVSACVGCDFGVAMRRSLALNLGAHCVNQIIMLTKKGFGSFPK